MADEQMAAVPPSQELAQAQSVNAFNPDGEAVSIPSAQVPHALQLGYKVASPDQVQQQLDKQQYGSGIGNALKAAALGFARSTTLGAADEFWTNSGLVSPHTLQAFKTYQGGMTGVGEGAGIITTLGLAPEAEGVEAAATALKAAQASGDVNAVAQASHALEAAKATLTSGDLANPLSAINKIGTQVQLGIATPEAGRIATTLAHGANAALQGAAFGVGDSITEHALGDPDLNAQKVMSNIGLNALFGGALGAAIGGAGSLIGKAPQLEAVSNDLDDAARSRLNTAAQNGEISGNNLGDVVNAAPIGDADKKGFFDGLSQQKSNAKEIIAAAKDINAPILESQVSASKHVQDYDSMLMQSPTIVGVQRQQLLQDGLNKAQGAIKDAISDGTDLSLAEVGDQIKQSISQKLAEETAPINKLYEDLKTHYGSIDVSESATKQIAQNIRNLEDVKLSPSSPEAQLANRVAGEIENLKNLDDVKRYGSILRRNSGPETRYIVGQIAEKLSNLEESTLARYADQYSKAIPGVKDDVMDLFSQRKGANAMYATLREKMGTLGDALGKRKIYGPQDFQDFISDMGPEKFAKKLSDPKNSQLLKFMSENFKEETDMLMKYKRSEIMNKALKDGVVNGNMAIREINKLSPEMKRVMFSEEQLGKIKSAQTYLDALPKNINPSGTSKSEAYRRMFEHPFASFLQTGKDFIAQKVIQGSQPKEIQDLIGAQNPQLAGLFSNISKATQKSEALAKSIFTGQSTPTYSAYLGSKIKHQMISDRVSEYSNNPDKLMAHLTKSVSPVAQVAPNHATFLSAAAVKGVQFLNTKVPRNPNPMPLSPKYIPSKGEIADFNQYYQVVENPLIALHQLKQGTLNGKTIESLNAVYPKLYQEMQAQVASAMTTHLAKNKLIPYQTKQALSLFLNTDLTPSTTGQAIIANQMSLASRGVRQAQNEVNKQQKVSQSGLSKLNKAATLLTPQQQSAQRGA